jgi:hypothetical protein
LPVPIIGDMVSETEKVSGPNQLHAPPLVPAIESDHVTVRVAGVARPTGAVIVYLYGNPLRAYALTTRKRGIISASLPRLTSVGYNSVSVVYVGPGNAYSEYDTGVSVR